MIWSFFEVFFFLILRTIINIAVIISVITYVNLARLVIPNTLLVMITVLLLRSPLLVRLYRFSAHIIFLVIIMMTICYCCFGIVIGSDGA